MRRCWCHEPAVIAAAPVGELGFTFDRSGYRVPAIIASPWVEPGSVYNEEYRWAEVTAGWPGPGLDRLAE
jgi:phospholipase C